MSGPMGLKGDKGMNGHWTCRFNVSYHTLKEYTGQDKQVV